jgi:hypothetical protein
MSRSKSDKKYIDLTVVEGCEYLPLETFYASYILKCISEGRTRKEIVEEFEADEQLVLIWINYLMERNYLNSVSAVTNEGYAFLRNFIPATTEITTLYK